jgi:lysophospholipase L1-like esterase
MNTRTIRTLTGLALALSLAASASAQSQSSISFASYFSVGDSLAAGFSSGSLVETNQVNSVPALIARQAGAADFQQPLVSEPGIPPQLALVSLVPSPVIAPKATSSGLPKNLNLSRPYNNMAVPGATSVDALTRTTDNGGLHDLILRGKGTQVAQVAAARPSFGTLWIGNNDVLGAALRGRAIDGITLTPTATFRQVYGQIVGALRASGTKVIAANLPDVTTIPFVTTIKPYIVNPSTGQPVLINGNRVALIGPNGPLSPGTFVTLPASSLLAQGIGVPAALGGTGQPLPDEVILDEGEVALIRDHVNQNNQAIQEICSQAGFPVFDIHSLLDEFAQQGRVVGGVRLTTDFLTGGIFSYDGVHPSTLGYAVVANEWISAINANGGAVPLIDLAPYMGFGLASAAERSAAARPTWFEFTPEAYASLLEAYPLVNRP